METRVFPDGQSLGRAAAEQAAAILRAAIAARGQARLVSATGASQFEFLQVLVGLPVDWARVEMFHLDEYIGLPLTHPASFRKYLLERLIRPAGIGTYHLLDGERDPAAVCREVGARIQKAPVDLACVGIGENGHLAFNDPPADFETDKPYLVVDLDEACRRQQVGEGWYKSMDEVPRQAISMSIRQILKAAEIICICPEQRKAQAVKECLEGPVSNRAPASILRTHPHVTMYLDQDSSALLDKSA